MNYRIYKKSDKIILPIMSLESIYTNINNDDWNDLVIMKGTGIYDKKGVEIFEGDFCKNELDEYGLIMYSSGSFWLSFFDEPAKQHLSDFIKYDSKNSNLLITGLRSFNQL